jgi:hypothetical protein
MLRAVGPVRSFLPDHDGRKPFSPIGNRHHDTPADAVALSLSCEFLARAAIEEADLLGTLGSISPTGFEGIARDEGGGTRGKKWLDETLRFPLGRRSLFKLFTTKAVIRKFLQKHGDRKKSTMLFWDTIMAPPISLVRSLLPISSYRVFCSAETSSASIRRSGSVWMVRGTRGDFVDYQHVSRVGNRPNWAFDVLETGAFPHFEAPAPLAASHGAFLSKCLS